MLGERTSYKALACCGFIVGGFFLGMDQEKSLGEIKFELNHSMCRIRVKYYFCSIFLGTLSMFGAFCGIASSVFVALNAIYTTRCLPFVDRNVWRLCLYNNFNACILFLPLMLIFGEVPIVFKYPKLFNIEFLTAMTLAGLLGFSMGYVSGYQIQMTSPLTHNVSGTAKSYVQTLIAVVVYTEVK
jgi:GDP-fucose transporter C1